MEAVLVNEKGRLRLGEYEKPVAAAGELLVKVKATAVNRADLLQKRGGYPPPEGASPILGLEMAGVVEETGDEVEGWKKGDRVFALLPGGGYAAYAAVPADMAMRIPNGLSFEEAAAIPEVFLTAYMNLFWLGRLRKD
ncbi:MAG TPA: alcohol dehydrogenase catalytic domain-containing protein, partial [Bacillales bacterium]|nr:alcohol dehydrogenase catalytic domain-containing protein [Bacillales bacterium]